MNIHVLLKYLNFFNYNINLIEKRSLAFTWNTADYYFFHDSLDYNAPKSVPLVNMV